MCRDLDAAGFAKNTGIPMDMSRIFVRLRRNAQEIGADRAKSKESWPGFQLNSVL
jgi:hypothetical protein